MIRRFRTCLGYVTVLATMTLFLAGCKPATVTVKTEPSGADVLYNGKVVGQSPLQFQIQEAGVLLVRKAGFKEESVNINLATEGGVFEYSFPMQRLAPQPFVQTMEATWATVEVRDGLDYEQAWTAVIDLLVKKFDVEILSKEDGYARTGWLYTWTGEMRSDYRVRVTVKFSPDRSKVEVKSEANYQVGGNWVQGTDTALLQTLKTDLMGSIGRTTR